MAHPTIHLELRVKKPANIYRFIYDWLPVPSSHGDGIFYLMLHARVKWPGGRLKTVFLVAMQYSAQVGEKVAVGQPAHILEQDLERFSIAWDRFTRKRIGKR